MRDIDNSVGKTNATLKGFSSGLGGIAASIAGAFTIGAVTNFARSMAVAGDSATQLKAKLNFAVGEGAFDQSRASADKLGVSVKSVAETMARLGNATKDVGLSREQLTDITETLIQMGRIAGATGTEIESALTQFSQGLAKGRLDGDELKSVLEAMPPLARLLAKELGVSIGELRDLGAEGAITSDVIISAFSHGTDEIKEQFASLPESLDQATARMSNSFQAMLAAFDNDLQVSGFYKFFSSQFAEIFDSITSRLSVADVTPRVEAYQRLLEIQTKIADIQGSAIGGSTPGAREMLADLERQAVEARAEVDKLGAELHAVASDSLNLQRLTNSSGIADRPGAPLPANRSEKALDKAVEARLKAGEAADKKRVASAKKAAEDAAKLEEDRIDDFQRALKEETKAVEKAIKDREKLEQDRIDDFQQALKTEVDAVEAAEKKKLDAAQRAADDLRDILIEPWKDLAAGVSSIATEMFDDILVKGEISGKKLADSFGSILRTTISGTAGALITQPINAAIGQIATESLKPGSGIGSSLTQFATNNPYLASAAAGGIGGYAAGSIYAQVTGKEDTYASTGGAVGGAAGALAGAYIGTVVFPGVGTLAGAAIGGVVGTVAGTLGGSLFGGGDNLGNDRSDQAYRTDVGKIAYSDSSSSAENRSITSGVLGQVGALQEALEGLGATTAATSIQVRAGNESGYELRVADGSDRRFDNIEDLTQAAIEQLLSATSNLGVSEQTALENTKARTPQEVLNDLDLAKTFDRLTFTGTDAQRALLDLDESFAGVSRRAKDLGLDTDKLAEAQKRAQDEIRAADRQQRVSFQRSLVAVLQDSSLGEALAALDDQFASLAKQAKDLGYSTSALTQIEQAHLRERQQTIDAAGRQERGLERGYQGQIRGIDDYFSNLIEPLKAVNQNQASPLGQIEASRRRFQETADLAQGGDLRATQELAGRAQELQGLSGKYLGSGGMGAEIAREIERGTGSVRGLLERQERETLASLPQVQRETVAEQIKVMVEQADLTRVELAKIRRELQLLRSAA